MTERPLLHHVRTDRSVAGAPAAADSATAATAAMRTTPATPAVPLILGPSIGTSLRLWADAVPELAADRTVIRYDLPGHGGTSAATLPNLAPGATTVADLAHAVLDLADHLGVDRFAYAGVSLGGAVGTWLAVHHSDRLAALALVCSSARFGDPESWHDRADLVRRKGTGPVADTTAERWFTARFAASGDPTVSALINDLRAADPQGYAACCDALAAFDAHNDLGRITAPTLIIAGREDPATPVAHARELADGIANATLLELAHTSHLAPAEQPHAVAAALRAHLARELPPDATAKPDTVESALAEGMAVRRAVLGDAHVNRAVANTTPFTADFQNFITRYAWGEIWTRPGLDRRMRSAITLTALVAHGHDNELAMHVRAALTNGLTRDEIGEVLLQCAVYCGVPAANSAFAVAQRVLAEIDAQPGTATG